MIRRIKVAFSKVIGRKSRKPTGDWYRVPAVYRLAWENGFQLGTADAPGVFDDEYAQRLSNQAAHFTRETARLARSVVYANGLLLILLSTKGPLPSIYGVDLSSFFFVAEALLLWSTTAFAFLAINFVNQQAYEQLLGTWCWNRHPQDSNVLLASYVPTQLILRVLSKKLSSPLGADRLRPGKAFSVLNFVTWCGVLLLTLSLPTIQIAITTAAAYQIMEVQNLGWWGSLAVSVVATIVTIFAIFTVVSTGFIRLPVRVVDMNSTIVAEPLMDTKGEYTKMAEQRFSDLNASSPLLAEIEARIASQYLTNSGDEKIQGLTRALALATLMFNFEQTYRLIYGSQIRGLRKLKEINETTLENAREFFTNDAVARFPDYYINIPFDEWLSFLVTRDLIRRTSAAIAITERGREFLRFLDEAKYREDKAF